MSLYIKKIATFALGLTSRFVQDEFSGVITKALSTLVLGLETRLEVELANMARLPWATLEGVGDQSEYVFLTKTSFTAYDHLISTVLECDLLTSNTRAGSSSVCFYIWTMKV